MSAHPGNSSAKKASPLPSAYVEGSKPRRMARGYGASVTVRVDASPEHRSVALQRAAASMPPGSPVVTIDTDNGTVRYQSHSLTEVETAWKSGRDLAKLCLVALGYRVKGAAR